MGVAVKFLFSQTAIVPTSSFFSTYKFCMYATYNACDTALLLGLKVVLVQVQLEQKELNLLLYDNVLSCLRHLFVFEVVQSYSWTSWLLMIDCCQVQW